MGTAIVYGILLAAALAVAGSMLPSLNFVSLLPGWSNVVDIINYGFLFVDPTVFITCLTIIVLLEQSDLVWSIGQWVINLVKP